jgi:hypothetical protein
VFAALTIAGGTALAMKWRESMELRVTLERAKIDADELARLRDENGRLRAQEISPAELERLRSERSSTRHVGRARPPKPFKTRRAP